MLEFGRVRWLAVVGRELHTVLIVRNDDHVETVQLDIIGGNSYKKPVGEGINHVFVWQVPFCKIHYHVGFKILTIDRNQKAVGYRRTLRS